MQYILTQEEYVAMKQRQEVSLNLSKTKLQQLCTNIADNMPVKVNWRESAHPTPWGCIITYAAKGEEHYCDECPVREICPREYKEYSK